MQLSKVCSASQPCVFWQWFFFHILGVAVCQCDKLSFVVDLDSECSYYMALLWFSFGSFLAETRMMVWGAVLFLVKRYAPNKPSEKQNINWSKGLYVCNVQCATSMQHTSFPTFMPSTSSIIWFSHEICKEVLQSVLLDIIRWEIFWQQLQLPCLSTKDQTSGLSWSS